MGAEERDIYLCGLDAPLVPLAEAIADAVEAAAPDLESRISYKMLMYVLGPDRGHFVCAIDFTKRAACLRFLFGAYLADPHHLLRAGTSHLSTIDYTSVEAVDPAIIAAYVREAVAGHAGFKARADAARASQRA